MAVISNQVQTLTIKLLTPFSAHNNNMQVFFQNVAEKAKQREKQIEEQRKEEMRKREVEV